MPPTDPRILAMTTEQMDLEFALMAYDKAQKEEGAESFEDDQYESWDEESDEHDIRLSDPMDIPAPSHTTKYMEDEWEPIE